MKERKIDRLKIEYTDRITIRATNARMMKKEILRAAEIAEGHFPGSGAAFVQLLPDGDFKVYLLEGERSYKERDQEEGKAIAILKGMFPIS